MAWDGEGDETVFEGSSSIVPGRRDSPSERSAALRAHYEDEFWNFINLNFRSEEDKEFYEFIQLEYPWLFVKPEDYDCPEDEQWLRYEHNCYVNSIYDTKRRI